MAQTLSKRLVVWGIAIALVHTALLFVVIPVLTSRLHGAYGSQPFADGYDQLAINLSTGHGYRFYADTAPTMMREPGYPVLLAGLMLLFGNTLTMVRITNLAFALGAAYVIFRIAKMFVFNDQMVDRIVLYGAPLLFLFHPGILVAETRGGVEVFFGFLVSLLVFTICRAVERDRTIDFVLAGLVLGLTVLVRSTPMLFPGLLLLYLVWTGRRRADLFRTCRNIVLMVVAMVAMLSPWIIRNYRLTGKVVPSASVLGVSAQAGQYIGEHEFNGKSFLILDREASRERDRIAMQLGYPFEDGAEGYYQTFYKSMDELSFSSYLFKMVVARYKASPGLFATCVSQNILNFWFAGKTWTTTALNMVIQIPYIILALVGSFGLLKGERARLAGVLVLFIGYVMAVHIPILAQARYSIPLIPVVAILAAKGIGMACKKMQSEPHFSSVA
jgi:4-amino-4-deoxy-L-arabinose transferase-like glycosyltransferase